MGLISFVLLSFCASVAFAASDNVVVCYYGTWATYRWSEGKFDVDHINPGLCTHLVYAFIGIDSQGTAISLDPSLDLAENWGRDNFRKFTSLKDKNPNLKTLLAVGGWNEGSAKYSTMAASATSRKNFIQSALKMIQDHNFDGLDVDWEYPGRRDTVYGAADITNFSQLLKELREEFDKHGLLVTAAVSAVESTAVQSYDIPTISKYLDLIHVMTYDMYGAWDTVTGHNAPLYRGEGDSVDNEAALFTVQNAIEYWLRAGCPPEKLVMGVPFYGRTFTLTDANTNAPRSPACGAGIAGQYTATSGFVGYNEFCKLLKNEAWTVREDSLAKVPYAFRNNNWVSFDNIDSIATKVDFALSYNLRGIMIWSIETDDFNGLCGNGDFPLLRTINKGLGVDLGSSTASPNTPTSSVTSAPSSEATSEPLPTTSAPIETTRIPEPTQPSSSICKNAGFAPNPQDCSSYYMCIEQADQTLLPIKFQCPSKLFWDQSYLNCNYDYLVECQA